MHNFDYDDAFMMWRNDSLEKAPKLRKTEDSRIRATTDDKMIGWHSLTQWMSV